MQGFNMGRYVPPDLEGTISGNKLNRKHPLGARASKLSSQGILTVRFEMPFAVWCAHCPEPTIIGQGVRFNAEKKRVGSYHSTPIFSFRMRHADCGGWIEVRTDPQNTTYVVVEGGKKRDTGDENREPGLGEVVILTDREREKLRTDAFSKLERTIEDREQLIRASARIDELEEANQRTWEDPYELNRRLRKDFRVGRHAREKEGKAAETLQAKMSFGYDLVPATEADAKRAALVDFGPANNDGPAEENKALAKPLFKKEGIKPETPAPNSSKKRKLKSEIAAEQMRESLVSEILGNTRASQDPFLQEGLSTPRVPTRMPGLKRKRTKEEEEEEEQGAPEPKQPQADTAPSTLVSYDSDSE